MTSQQHDHYAELGVRPDATEDEIKTVYKALLKVYHPDLATSGVSAAKVRQINAALEILGDPSRRRAYDRERGSANARCEDPKPSGERKNDWARGPSFSPEPPDPLRDRFHRSSGGDRHEPRSGTSDTGSRSRSSERAAAQFDIQRKNILVTYVLWAFLGYCGAHRFYLGRPVSGTLMLGTSVIIMLLTLASLGIFAFLFLLMAVWWVIDALLIPGIAREYNTDLADSIFI